MAQYEIDMNPDEPTLRAPLLSQLIDVWLTECSTKLPMSTVEGYRLKVVYFQRWWAGAGPSVDWEFKADVLGEFNAWLANEARTRFGKPLSFNTQKDVLRRLRQAWLWAYQTRRLPIAIAEWIPEPIGSAPLRVAVEVERLVALFDAALSGPDPARDRVLLAVLIGTGLRRAEASGLDASDVTVYADLSGKITVRRAKKVRGRTVHGRIVAFDAATGALVRSWLDMLSPGSPLFPSTRGGRLSPQGIYKVVRRCGEAAGITKEQLKGPHDLRRLFATTFARYRRGESHGQLLSMQLGHSSFAATVRNGYSLQDIEDVRGAMISPMTLIGGHLLDKQQRFR